MIELLLIAVGLSMDAFAVSVSKGLCMDKINYSQGLKISTSFGLFQAIMPLIGWFLGLSFYNVIHSFDYLIGFALLNFIGIKMILEAKKTDDNNEGCKLLTIKELFILGFATSIDALAVGITFSFIPDTNILFSCLIIGITTFILSFLGMIIGQKYGNILGKKAHVLGGIILMLIGLKMLFEHYNYFM